VTRDRRLRHWPLTELELRTERLCLRLPADAELDHLAGLAMDDAAAEGGRDPHRNAWPPAGRHLLLWHWQARGGWSPRRWHLALVAFDASGPVGCQELRCVGEFPETRALETFSWLLRRRRGGGLGREMRAAALDLAFHGLGADTVLSECDQDNLASAAVSRRLGYRQEAAVIPSRIEGSPARLRFRLDRAVWIGRGPAPATIIGLESCRWLFAPAIGGAA
jgi:RimJ/RimL family protein N-acetyltransferase